MKKEIINSLTGIRGVAAVYVLIYHLFHHSSNINFIKNGYISVDLFFILSGFIITHAHLNDFKGNITSRSYFKFMLSRIARIWPAYLSWLIFNIAIAYAKGKQISPTQIIPNIFMVQNWGLAQSIIGTGWSLSVEFLAYFFFPIICITVINGKKINSLFIALISIVSIIIISIFKNSLISGSQMGFSGPIDIVAYDGVGPLIRGIAEFSLGVIGYKAYSYLKGKPHEVLNIATYFIAIVAIACLTVKGFDVLFVLSVSLLIPLLASTDNLVTRLLSTKLSLFLGKISFSLYLCHLPAIYFIYARVNPVITNTIHDKFLSEILSGIVCTLSCTVIAWISYEILEKRLRIYIKSLNPSKAKSA
ncbi:TPA: acyltransferase [Pluralibacter gergoviae]|nr:acyltransferase [Pluralibacter gergoviae]HDS1241461.1 acyltransferase [Pluralibacter gergoviae]HDS1248940.1 acyltransferase [Pluralibacter gergoviae]HDS1254132.1 acyltransferase [Pluralibacter gergoviae]HDS1257647.1 acyltransferase [Pluralibacter gergoviae]